MDQHDTITWLEDDMIRLTYGEQADQDQDTAWRMKLRRLRIQTERVIIRFAGHEAAFKRLYGAEMLAQVPINPDDAE